MAALSGTRPSDASAAPARLRRVAATLALVTALAWAGAACPSAPPPAATPPPPAGDATLAAALQADVAHLSRDLAPRDEAHPEVLDRVAAWLGERLRKAGGAVVEQPFAVEGRTYRNVIATFGPEAGPRLVVGAHYDSAGPRPGADDNASGVAVLLALAERLGAAPPKARVDLVAWTLEEPPWFATEHMGSAVHARSLVDAGAVVTGVVSLETLGYYRDAPGTQTFPDPALAAKIGDRGDFLAVVGRPEDEPLLARLTPAFDGLIRAEALAAPASVRGVAFSDQRSYWPRGFLAAMLTDTAFFRNARYHTDDDTPDTLDYPRLAKVAHGVERAVRALTEVAP